MRPISAATRLIASVYGIGLKPDADDGISPLCRHQSIGMRALQVALHALGTEHAAIEGKVFPRLEADDLVVAHLELDPALLSAEAAMGLYQPVGLDAGRQPHARHRRQVRPELLDDAQGICWNLSHAGYLASRSSRAFKYLLPQRALRQAEERAPTPGAHLLVVAALRQLVAKPEFAVRRW